MDQVKEFLRQAIKHRFWIATGVAMLLPVIAYFLAAGSIQEAAASQTSKIKAAYEDAGKYTSNVINRQYSEEVDKRKEPLTKDVAKTWRILYERQAPLLKWPPRVHDTFTKWGRERPDVKKVRERDVELARSDYVIAYNEDFVQKEVYNRFKPFDYETGEGLVAAPDMQSLLQPPKLDEANKPTLPEIWAIQEKLWIQSTLLDVISKVNGDAKTWDDAVIKQVNTLQVANESAQDQVSIAKAQELVSIEFKNAAEDEKEESADAGGGGGGTAAMAMMGSMGGGRSGEGAMSGGGGGFGGAASSKPDKVKYVKQDTEMFQVVPVYMSVLIDQNKIVDYLCALENSPMMIQVRDFEMSKPKKRIVKPEKGSRTDFGSFGGYAGLGGGRGMMGMEDQTMGMGMGMGMGPGMGPGMGYNEEMMSMGGGRGGMMGMPGMGGMGGGAPQGAAVGKGADIRTKNTAADRKKQEEEAKKAPEKKLFDPYYNIVQVSIYGHARFYRKPTEETQQPASQAQQ